MDAQRRDLTTRSLSEATLRIALGAESLRSFLTESLAGALSKLHCQGLAVVTPREGEWSSLATVGTLSALPVDLLAEAADTDAPAISGKVHVYPLGGERLLAAEFGNTKSDPASNEAISAWARTLGEAVIVVAEHEKQSRRLSQIETILELTSQWNRTHETEPLLRQMAAAATRLMDADRASIFLWDKTTKTLVGRPALGVSGGELRVPDDVGLVGEVLRTGMPARVTGGPREGPDKVHRPVDEATGYTTRTLLGVPLCGASGELFGVFEVINKRNGGFTKEDEESLVELASHAARALEDTLHWEELTLANRQMSDEAASRVRMVGECAAMSALRSTVRRVAQTDLAVLVLGENGTGKEVVAQSIHFLGQRRDRPFVAVNCAGIPETLLESELFGHEKGAFTGADTARAGKFELAAEGSLFLDEIGDMSLAGQAKLLRVLEEKVVVRVGGSTPIPTKTRIIAATNQDLLELVQQKRFRQDLYFRLNVVTIDLPPLRERDEDVLLLAEHFLEEFCRKARRRPPKLTPAARRKLLLHRWPGNVRELRNLM
jgi:transcriptional regulator with GAF, ATPase, and Fis domain